MTILMRFRITSLCILVRFGIDNFFQIEAANETNNNNIHTTTIKFLICI